MQIRLDRFLADAGLGTRSEVKSIIKKKSVTLNGVSVERPETKVNPDMDEVSVNGEPVNRYGSVTWLLHKPAGYVCAVKDDRFPTVMELVPRGRDLFPVGRLDKDTEGLLLITNDGAMAHRMLSPRSHVDKTYMAVLDRPAEDADVSFFAGSVDIGDETRTLPAKLVIPDICVDDGGIGLFRDTEAAQCTESVNSDWLKMHAVYYLPSEYRTHMCPGQLVLLTIQEGRYHQVKRMFHAAGKEVVYLKRLTFGPWVLPLSLKKGEAILA